MYDHSGEIISHASDADYSIRLEIGNTAVSFVHRRNRNLHKRIGCGFPECRKLLRRYLFISIAADLAEPVVIACPALL